MLFKLSNLNSNLALTVGYLNPALNNSAQNTLRLLKVLTLRLLKVFTLRLLTVFTLRLLKVFTLRPLKV